MSKYMREKTWEVNILTLVFLERQDSKLLVGLLVFVYFSQLSTVSTSKLCNQKTGIAGRLVRILATPVAEPCFILS